MDDIIDWSLLRQRIAETTVVSRPVCKKKEPKRSPEAIERRREASRRRSKKYYQNNKERCHIKQREWTKNNPEKVKAKRKRFYEAHKNDPNWVARKHQIQLEFLARKKLEQKNVQTDLDISV